MHGAAQGAAQSSTLDGVCLNVLELACLKFSGLVLANFELFDKRLQGATSMDATKQTRWAYDAWRACSRFHRLRTQVGKKKSQAAMNAQQPLNHIVAPETEAKQESMTVIVDVTRIPAPPWPAPLEQPALLEQFGHVGQPIYGTDGTDGHFDLPIFGPLLAESILGQVAESILGQVAGLILGPVVAEYKLGPVAAEPPVGHNVGPSIGQDGQPSNGQVDQPIDGQDGQRGTGGTEPSTGQVDQPIYGHDGQRGTDGTEPSTGQVGQPIYGQDGQRGTDGTEPSTGQVGQPTENFGNRECSGDEFVSFEAGSLMPPMRNLKTAGLRRSPRIAAQERKPWHRCNAIYKCFCVLSVAAVLSWSPDASSLHSRGQNLVFATVDSFHAANQNFDSTLNNLHPMALLAEKQDNESYTFREMLKQSDAAEFIKAMMKETSDHESRNHWTVIPRFEKPPDVKTILAIWAFKRKRYPDGRINKWKARLCAHGGMQTYGQNYWETYAPTVNWISIRFLLIIAQILDLNTQAIDFVLAFPQADLDVPVYMELPAGMDLEGKGENSSGYVLRLNKSLYGLKQGSYNWHNKLKKGLLDRGFVESISDPCVFISKDMIILVYVDDCILLSKEELPMKTFVQSLKDGDENFDFTEEGTLENYLGVNIAKLPGGEGFEMSQPFLIDRIIKAINFDSTTTKSARDNVPAVYPLLNKDVDGPARKAHWKYRGLIGMLGYLQGTSRPDIAMATHQCARFNNDPKLSHDRAVKKIVRYLLDTRDKGIIFKPDLSKGLECYVDADFAGGWKDGDHDAPESVLSRTGYVIMYAGCPITWGSRMQTEIALSTTESEYIALSTAMREVIPFIHLMKEIASMFGLLTRKPVFKCQVWEDNDSCITVAKAPKFTPRTKHIAIKYHHFRSFVSDGSIVINPIDTSEQLADIFTKPLKEKSFCYLRRGLMGW